MSKNFLFPKKFDASLVFDCQRSPAYPEAGVEFKAYFSGLPYKADWATFTKEELEGNHFQFKYEGEIQKVALYLIDKNEQIVGDKICTGDIYGISEKGFLFVSDEHDYGYFFPSKHCSVESGEVTYTPEIGKADFNQIKDLLTEGFLPQIVHSTVYGGWLVKPEVYCGGSLPQKIATGFAEAMSGIVGAYYIPHMYCASQVANGTNHMLICEVESVIPQGAKHIVKVILHETPDPVIGTFTLISVETIV